MERTPPAMKNKLCRFENWVEVSLSRPVLLSRTPPVAVLYLVKALVARRTRVVPKKELFPVQISRMASQRTSVNNTGGGGKDGVGSTVANGLVNTPELAGGRGSGDRTVRIWRLDFAFDKILRMLNTYMKVIDPVNLELSVPPRLHNQIK